MAASNVNIACEGKVSYWERERERERLIQIMGMQLIRMEVICFENHHDRMLKAADCLEIGKKETDLEKYGQKSPIVESRYLLIRLTICYHELIYLYISQLA